MFLHVSQNTERVMEWNTERKAAAGTGARTHDGRVTTEGGVEMLHQVQSLWRISGRSSKPMDFKCSKWQSPLLQIRIIMADFKFY